MASIIFGTFLKFVTAQPTIKKRKNMELPNRSMDFHLEMERHVSTMRAAMNAMENRKKHKIGKMPNGSTVR